MNEVMQNAIWAVTLLMVTWWLLQRRVRVTQAYNAGFDRVNRDKVLNSMGHGGFFGGVLGGMSHGGHGGHGEHDDTAAPSSNPPAGVPDAAIDPVSGEALSTARALTSVFQGKIYFFASKESRDRFEAAPQDYAQKATGHPLTPADGVYTQRPPRRRGC